MPCLRSRIDDGRRRQYGRRHIRYMFRHADHLFQLWKINTEQRSFIPPICLVEIKVLGAPVLREQ